MLLAKNVDKVLTHTFITHEIWGTSWDSDIASLRVFMRTLRKKIEADPSHPAMIQTHVGWATACSASSPAKPRRRRRCRGRGPHAPGRWQGRRT
ncbi:MAG: helix-turn-helix domain-containing protein [Collinsella sp.]